MLKIADYDEFLVAVKHCISLDFRYAGTGSLPGTPEDIAWLEKMFGKYSTPFPRFRKTNSVKDRPTSRFIPTHAMTAAMCSVNPVTGKLDYIFLAREKKDCALIAESGLKCHDCRNDCCFPFFHTKSWKVMTELPDMNYTTRTEWDFFVDDEYLSIICQLAAVAIKQCKFRLVPVLMSYIRRLPALGDAERIPEYLAPLKNLRRLDANTLYYIHYSKPKPGFGTIRFCEDSELLERVSSNALRRARYDKEIRKFLERNPPEKVRELMAESGIEFPEAPFKSEAHYQSYFRRVQNLLLNEQKKRPDNPEETDAEEKVSPEPAAGPGSAPPELMEPPF